MTGGPTSWGGWNEGASAMFLRPESWQSDPTRRRRKGRARWRRLLVEQFEMRVLLDAGPNTAPIGQNHLVSAVEDTSFRFAAADFPYSDAESNALVAVKIDTLPMAGSLTLFNPSNFTATDVSADQVVSMADISAGNLRFQGAPNASGSPYTAFTFQVEDNGGTAVVNGLAGADLDPTPRTMTITVLSVNDAPRGADRQITIREDDQYQFSASDFGFSDANDTPPAGTGPANTMAGIVITSVPSPPGGTLILNHTIVVSPGTFIAAGELSELVFTPAANAYGTPLTALTFRVKDNGGTAVVFGSDGSVGLGVDTDFNSRTLTLSVAPVSDAPLGMDGAVTTVEDTAYLLAVADFGFSDPMDFPLRDTFVAVKITTLPASGALMLNGTLVAAGTTVPVASLNAGELKFVPFPSASGLGYARFTFQVQDSGSLVNGGMNLDPTPNTISISVLTVNDPPASKDTVVSYIYGGGHGTTLNLSSFSFTDLADFPQNRLAAVKITTLPGSGTLSDGGNPVTVGQVIAVADVASGLVHYQPTVVGSPFMIQDAFGFQVQDDGGTANGGSDLDPTLRTVTLLGYSALGDPPVAAADRTLTLLEDHVDTFSLADFDFTDPQDGSSVQSITISSLQQMGVLRLLGVAVFVGTVIPASLIQAGGLQFTPNPDFNGLTQFGAGVQDSAGSRDFPYAIGMSVMPVNDSPMGGTGGVTATEDTAYTFGVSDFGFSDFRDSPQNNFYTVRIVSPPSAGLLTCGGVPVKAGDIVLAYDIAAGKLKFTPPANANGPGYASFSFQLQDDGGTANGGIDISGPASTLTINVMPVNDRPQGMNAVVAVAENTSYTFTMGNFGFSDPVDLPLANNLRAVEITTVPDKGTLTMGGTAVGPGQLITAADVNAGNLRFTPGANATGSPYTSFTFQVEDDGGTVNGGADLDLVPRTLTINVFRQECQPPIGTNLVVTTAEDTPYALRVSDFPVSMCSDGLSVVAVRIMSLPTPGTLKDNGALVQPGQYVPVSDVAAGRLVYTPPADANGAALAAFTFEIKDDGGTAGGRVDLDPFPRTMTINVQAVNDPPVSCMWPANSGASIGTESMGGRPFYLAAAEDASYRFSVNDFGFCDVIDSPPNAFLNLIITLLPSSGTLTLDNLPIASGNLPIVVPVSSLQAGRLSYVPPLNANGYFWGPGFKLQDNGGTAYGGQDTSAGASQVEFHVFPVNDAPAGHDNTVTTLEDQTYTFTAADFGFSDPSDALPMNLAGPNGLKAVRLTTVPNHGALMLGNHAVAAFQSVAISDIGGGLLRFVPSANENGSLYATFTFQVQDDGGTASGGIDTDPVPNTMTINVTPVNDAPSGADRTIAIAECKGISHVFVASDFGYADLFDSPANQFAGIIITSLPSGQLTDDGIAVVIGQFVSFFDLIAAKLVFSFGSIAPNPWNSFTFRVKDNGGTVNGGMDVETSSHTMTLVAFDPLPPPASEISSQVTGLEDVRLAFSGNNLPLVDLDGNAVAGVTILSLPARGTLRDNGVAVSVGQVILPSDIAQGFLVYNPPPDAYGQGLASFSFEVEGDFGFCGEWYLGSMTITIMPVNDPPLGGDSRVTTLEDQALVLSAADFPFSDSHDSPAVNQLVGVKISTLPAGGVLVENGVPVLPGDFVSIHDIQSGGLRFVPAANANGLNYASFTFQVKDDGGTANGGIDFDPTPRTIVINVTPVNDPPAFGMQSSFDTTDESGPQAIAGWASGVAGPPDEIGQGLRFVVVGNSHPELFAVQPTIDPAGKLTFTPAANGSGSAEIEVVLQDDGGRANGGIDTSPPRTVTIEVAKAHVGHNAHIGTDVTGDGHIAPSDALAVIDFINAYGSQAVVGDGAEDGLYCDVNGDGFIAPSDALEVINEINAFGGSEGEGQAARQTAAMDDMLAILAADVVEVGKKRG